MNDESDDQVAWTATPYRAPVLDAEGHVIGTTESLLGDEGEDIFHGLAVKTAEQRGHRHQVVEIAAADVTKITATRVYTSLTPSAVAELPPYKEEKWFHLGWGGLFRKRPEWRAG
jgi:hypothetical protein